MDNELRKNPRFVATEGLPAKITVEGKALEGTILNFSSTGFAVVVEEDVGEINQSQIEVVFSAECLKNQLKLSALITNKRPQDIANTRLGCYITDMHHQSNDYFVLLTNILGKQGLLRSMATKPKKYLATGSA